MLTLLKQFIASSLPVVLACSCSGFSFGMIGHGFVQMGGVEHESKAMHECCGITDADQAENSAAGINHHTPTVATLSFLDLLIVLFVVFVAVAWPEPIRKVVSTRFQLYARIWFERWSYFALYLTQLFSRGILHSKAW